MRSCRRGFARTRWCHLVRHPPHQNRLSNSVTNWHGASGRWGVLRRRWGAGAGDDVGISDEATIRDGGSAGVDRGLRVENSKLTRPGYRAVRSHIKCAGAGTSAERQRARHDVGELLIRCRRGERDGKARSGLDAGCRLRRTRIGGDHRVGARVRQSPPAATVTLPCTSGL